MLFGLLDLFVTCGGEENRKAAATRDVQEPNGRGDGGGDERFEVIVWHVVQDPIRLAQRTNINTQI